jgi:hypothetical protein
LPLSAWPKTFPEVGVVGDAGEVKWWRRKKKVVEPGDDAPRRGRPVRNEVKDLRARLTGEGYTLKH